MPTQVLYQQNTDIDDEIDISELFNKIWFRRKFIVAFVFVVGVIVFGVLSAQLMKKAPEKRYSEILQFNFPAAEKGLYPGGQKFSYNDIVSAKVLEEVYEKNDLQNHGLKFEKFIDAVTVNPFSENEVFIKEKYQGLLANKKLSRPEIESLEAKYLEELNVAQSRFVRVSFLESSLQGIDKVLIEKVLLDIPRVWSRFSIEELGVLDLKIAGANFYQATLINRFEYLQTLEYLTESSKYLETALDDLVSDEIGGLVRNAKSGQTGFDLLVQLRNLVAFEIEPLFSTVTNLGITKDSEKALIYLKNTVQNLEDKKSVLQRKSANIERIIDQYASSNLIKGAENQDGITGGYGQYDGTFLDKFANMIEEKNDKAFKQELFNQRLLVLQQIEDIEGQIVKFQRAEKRLTSNVDAISSDIRQGVINDIDLVRVNFEKLLSEYQLLLDVRNQQVLGNTAGLYQVTSNELIVDSDLKSRLKTMIIVLVLASAVAFMLAVVISLFKRLPEKAVESADS